MYLDVFAGRAENWKSASYHHTGTTVRSGVDVETVSRASAYIDRRRRISISYLREENAGSSSSTGVWPHPAAKAPVQGAEPKPFVPLQWARVASSRAAPPPLIARSPVRLRIAPAGLRGICGAGERGAPLRGVKGDPTPRTCSNRVSDGPVGTGAHVVPAGALSSLEQTSESQPPLPVVLFRRSLPGPRDSTGDPPLLRRRSSRRTRVGRASRVAPTLLRVSARFG
jgi:hypothetical protein